MRKDVAYCWRCCRFAAVLLPKWQLTRPQALNSASLLAVGFVALPAAEGFYAGADVAVIQPITGHPHGHMAMFNGTFWLSDFKQLHGLYPGPGYRCQKPPFTVYRHGDLIAAPPPLALPSASAFLA